MTDRYLTAVDLSEDLRRWLIEAGREPLPAVAEEPASPKGLRSFDSEDARAFLSLLPGRRDSAGLPESIAFWKTRIEATDGDRPSASAWCTDPRAAASRRSSRRGCFPSSTASGSARFSLKHRQVRLIFDSIQPQPL